MELLFELLFALFPVWGTMFLLRVLSRPITWTNFLVHGEFAIYAAALVGPSLYQIWQWRQRPRAPGLGFLLIAVLGLLMATLLFAATAMEGLLPNVDLIDRQFLTLVSVVLLLSAILFVYLVKVLDNIHTSADIPREAAKEVDDLGAAVRGLG